LVRVSLTEEEIRGDSRISDKVFLESCVFDGLGADPFFSEQLHGRAEEVMKEPPGVFVESVEQRNHLGIV